MVQLVAKICSECEFYEPIRIDRGYGKCMLFPHVDDEYSTTKDTDSCDQWLQRSEDDL